MRVGRGFQGWHTQGACHVSLCSEYIGSSLREEPPEGGLRDLVFPSLVALKNSESRM